MSIPRHRVALDRTIESSEARIDGALGAAREGAGSRGGHGIPVALPVGIVDRKHPMA
jgi:hypothetical protein